MQHTLLAATIPPAILAKNVHTTFAELLAAICFKNQKVPLSSLLHEGFGPNSSLIQGSFLCPVSLRNTSTQYSKQSLDCLKCLSDNSFSGVEDLQPCTEFRKSIPSHALKVVTTDTGLTGLEEFTTQLSREPGSQ